MKILFIHSNYPAQFRNLAIALGSSPNHQVVFLSGNPKAAPWQLPGVSHVAIQQPPVVDATLHPWLQATDLAIRNGESVVRAMVQLKDRGFKPDLVISHAGTGHGLFVKDMFANAKLVSYFEWFFNDHTLLECFPDATQDQLVLWKRSNMTLLEELNNCDLAVTPTEWQEKQLPRAYRNKIHVIFDGIDTQFFHPSWRQQELHLTSLTNSVNLSIHRNSRLITYATRGMEPIRGFPEFMRMVPHLLEHYDDAIVVVAGEDRSCYGPVAPTHQGSWKERLLDELKSHTNCDLERLHFIGSLSYPQYRDLLCRSDLHCYFTRPYVPSWSLFEAAACGARLLTNRSPATETITSCGNLATIDLDDPEGSYQQAIDFLKRSDHPALQRRTSYLPEQFSTQQCMKKWGLALNKLIQNHQTAT